MGGDASAHGASAEDGCFLDRTSHEGLFEALYEKEQVTKPVWRGQTREDANREIGVPRFVAIQEIQNEAVPRE